MAANIFDEPFNGTSLQPVRGLTQTAGGAVQLLYGGSAQEVIAEGTSGADIRYAHDNRPGSRNYRVRVRANWLNPGGTGHIARVFARYDRANKNGYYVEVSSGLGTPTMKLYRLVNGTAFQLGSTFNIAPALQANYDYTFEVECVEDTIKAYWNGNEDPDAPDIEATDTLVYTQGYAGVGMENSVQTGGGTIKIEHLEVNTPYDTGTGVVSPQGLLLKVDGIEFDEEDLENNMLQITDLTKSIVGVDTLTIAQQGPFTNPLFRPEQTVELYVDINSVRTRVFHGKLRNRPQQATGQTEGITYTAYGYRANWQYVKIRHQNTLSPQIVWNATQLDIETLEQDPDWDADFHQLTIGQFLKKIIDDNQDKIHFHFGSDPADGAPTYAAGTLDQLTIKPNKTVLRGNLDQFVQEAVSIQANMAPVMDYELGQMVIRDLSNLSAKDISFTDLRVPTVNITLDTTQVYTAARVTGVTEEVVDDVASFVNGELVKGWDTDLESEWSAKRARRRVQGFQIVTVDIGGGPAGRDRLVCTSNATTEKTFANEWKGTTLEVVDGPAAGEKHQIFSNTGKNAAGQYEIIIAGNFATPPVTTNYVRATDNMAEPTTNNRNGFFYVYRMFVIADETKQNIERNACPTIDIKYDIDTDSTKDGTDRKTMTGDLPKSNRNGGQVLADSPTGVPEIGYINYLQNSDDDCGVENDRSDYSEVNGDIKLNYKYKKTTVATVRYPEADDSYYGDAFSKNAALWGVANAVPEDGDLGVMREEDLEDSSLKYEVQKADWLTILAERVKNMSVMPFSGSIEYRGLDWENRNFEYKLTLSSAARPTGLESEDLIPIQWTWNFLTNTNTVQVGTRSILVREIERAKKTTNLERTTKTMEAKLEEFRLMQQCHQQGNPSDDGSDPNPVPASRVKSGANSTQKDTNESGGDHATRISGPGAGVGGPNCLEWLCGDKDGKTVKNPSQMSANAAILDALVFSDVVPNGWLPPGGSFSVLRGLDFVRSHLSTFMRDMQGALASQDYELGRAQIDMHSNGLAIKAHTDCLQNSRIQPIEDKLNELIARVNAMCTCLLFNDFRLAWCLSGKIDGPGAFCDVNLECCEPVETIDTEFCTWEWDPKTCDPTKCSEVIDTPPVPAEPK